MEIIGGRGAGQLAAQIRLSNWVWNEAFQASRIAAWIRAGAPGMLINSDSDYLFFGLQNQGSDRNDAVIEWGDNASTAPPQAQDPLRFVHFSGGQDLERMRIDPSGKVGIGTTAPSAKLDIRSLNVGSSGDPLGQNLWFSVGDPVTGPSASPGGKMWIQYGPQEAPLIVFNDDDDPSRIEFDQIGTGTEAAPQRSSWIGMAAQNSSNLALMGGNVGIGTITPTQPLHVAGNARFEGTFNGLNGVVTDNRMVASQSSFVTGAVSPGWADVPNSSKVVNIPSGTALIFWSLSGFAPGGGPNGVYHVRVVIGTVFGPAVSFATNEVYSHKTTAGSWATPVTAGNVTVKLQVRRQWPGSGNFRMDENDHTSWTLIVFRN